MLSKSLTTYLAIEESEVDFGIKKYKGFTSIFIFDTAKGGAGYSSQCSLYLQEIFTDAYDKLSKCNCKSACTKCLIDRGSQYYLDKLDRNSAMDWLKNAIDDQVSDEIKTQLQNNPVKILGSVKDDLARLLYKKQLKEIWLFVSDDIENWDIDSLQIINSLRQNNCKINFICSSKLQNLSLENTLSLIQIKAWSNIYFENEITTLSLKKIMRVKLINDIEFEYYTADYENVLNSNWSNSKGNYLYKQSVDTPLSIEEINIDINTGNVFETFIQSNQYIDANNLFDLYIENLEQKTRTKLKESMSGKSFQVCYTDKYLKSPLGCLLLLEFIKKMQTQLNFNINELNLDLKDCENINYRQNFYITENFVDNSERSNFIKDISIELDLNNISINHPQVLPHYRYFSFKNNNIEIIIRPDAGIEHGWFVRNKYLETKKVTSDLKIEIVQKLNTSLLYTLSFN